jgi:HAD superfamily hydrolase (TIGR01509 family)
MGKPGPGLAAVLWDVDGTLAETEFDGHRVAFNQAFAAAGMQGRWDRAGYRRWLAITGGRERMAAWLLEQEGQPPASGRLDALVRAKQDAYLSLVQAGGLSLRPGVARLIAELAEAGVRQAIVTTSSRRAVQALAEGVLGDLAAAFEFWVCGEDVQRKKPDPEAYLQALDRLAVPCQEVLAVEDSSPGLAAARAAGLTTRVTLSTLSAAEPAAGFAAAAAVLPDLGPPCGEGAVTLSYLQRLLSP